MNSLKSFYLHNNELSLGKLDAASMRCYFETLRDISRMVANPQIYQVSDVTKLFCQYFTNFLNKL